jgi:hypothetical protein
MPPAKVRWRLEEEEFEVIGLGRLWIAESEDIVGSRDAAGPAGLVELNRALDRYRATMYDGDFRLRVYDTPEEELKEDVDYLAPPSTFLEFAGGHTFIVLEDVFEIGTKIDQVELASLLGPQMQRHRARLMPISEYETGRETVVHLIFEISPRGRSVEDALQVGEDMSRLWSATRGGQLSPETIRDLIAAGRASLLIGQPECGWLECKGGAYGLPDRLEEFELAKDIAMLANRPSGGVLLIGPATKGKDGRDVIRKIVPQPMSVIRPAKYRGTIARTVFPPPQDLVVEAIQSSPGEGILYVRVPPQPEALRPFLVKGAVVDKKIVGSHFSLFYRREDKGVAITTEEIHGLLIAGRAALSLKRPESTSDTDTGVPSDGGLA